MAILDFQQPQVLGTYNHHFCSPLTSPRMILQLRTLLSTRLRNGPRLRPLGEFHHPDVPAPNAPRAMRPRQNDRPFTKGQEFRKGTKTVAPPRCAWKPGDSSLAPYFEGIFRYPSSLAPFQAPAGVEIGFLPAK